MKEQLVFSYCFGFQWSIMWRLDRVGLSLCLVTATTFYELLSAPPLAVLSQICHEMTPPPPGFSIYWANYFHHQALVHQQLPIK